MKNKAFFSLLFIFLTTLCHAQITINGHEAFYDAGTESFLFVVDSLEAEDFTANIQPVVGNEWTDIKINGVEISDNFYFGNVSQDRTFILTAQEGDIQLTRTLHFTTLPILSFSKNDGIGNDYGWGKIRFESMDTSFVSNCQIKIRGASSRWGVKKNYKFKLFDDEYYSLDLPLLGMRKSNSWTLDGGQVDLFRLRNNICHNLWLDFSTKPYYFDNELSAINGCHTRIVELFINNEYRGFYTIMEPVNQEQLKLKDCNTVRGGIRGLLYKAESWWGTTFSDIIDTPYDNSKVTWIGWETKYPEPQEDADTTDYKPLSDFINFVVSSPDRNFKDSINDIMDVPVFADYMLFLNLINGIDNTGKNMYWSIYDNTKPGCRKFVPTPWDMDATFGQYWTDNSESVDSVSISPTSDRGNINNLGGRLASNLGVEFSNYIEGRYAGLRKTFFSFDSLYKRFTSAYNLLKISGAANREVVKWDRGSDLAGNELNFENQLVYIKNWIAARLIFLDQKYHYENTTGIKLIPGIKEGPHLYDNNLYDLQGQRVTKSYKGIVIKNGRKYYQR